METLEALKTAYALIQNPERWTQDAVARDRFGNPTFAHDAHATSWCAIGSLVYAIPGSGFSYALDQLEAAAEGDIIDINNGPNGHARVCEAFRKAIADLTPREVPSKTDEKIVV